MTGSLGIEPGPHWWKAGAVTTTPCLHPTPPPPPPSFFRCALNIHSMNITLFPNDVISWHPKCPKSTTKHCNNHFNWWKTEKNYSKRNEKHGWTQMDKIETDCIWVILKKIGPTSFKFVMTNCLDKGRFYLESWCVWCNDNFLVKEFHITIFEF